MFLGFSTMSVYAQSKDGISVVSNSLQKKVNVSPNPAISEVKLSIEEKDAKLISISIYSIIGNEVFTRAYNTSAKIIDLDVRNLKKGKYMVRAIFDDNTSEVVTLIKQ